jgi:Na+-transporting NADH:ubiquinone oxidoreductase subunit A
MLIKLSKGLNIPMMGAPEPVIAAGASVQSVALLGSDYTGLKPKMLVEVGEQVNIGQALFVDKRDTAVHFTAPGSGTVSAINRGARRALQSVVIELDESPDTATPYAQLTELAPGSLAADDIRAALFTSGLWTAFRTRPYNKVPDSGSTPGCVFVTAIDTRPLAGNPEPVVAKYQQAFAVGLQILSRLTRGQVHVCTGPNWELAINEDQQIHHAQFSGPHPAGLPGTHIHHLSPVDSRQTVWHIGYQDVIAIGKLFAHGKIFTERTIALGGTGFSLPRMITTRLGANIDDLVRNELTENASQPMRLLSGCALDGRTASDAEAFLGRYHLQLTAINNKARRKLFGWLGLFDGNYSFASRIARRQGHASSHEFSTQQFGRPTALVPIDAFDRVIPMDILSVPLLRALLIRDTDQAQALGCLELDSEDLALCSFVCPGKNDYGSALQINLEQIERDG